MLKFIRFLLLLVIALLITQGINAFGFSGVVLADGEAEIDSPDFIYGDVTGDNKVNSIDFATMRQYLLGIISEFKYENGIKSADVDGNGVFNSIDFAYERQYLLRIIDDFPVNIPTPTTTPIPTATEGVTPTPSPDSFSQLRPSNIEVDIIGSQSIRISWDEVDGAIVYEIYRDDVIVDTTLIPVYCTSGLEEGKDYKYSIKAVNKEGQKSLGSSEIIVNTGDVTINSDTILSENRFYRGLHVDNGASLDLNGYTLNVQLDLNEISGKVNVNAGRLIVGREYSVGEFGLIEMKNEADYVYVGGNFSAESSYYATDKTEKLLTAGILEVTGNFSYVGEHGNFIASGSHKVILSGDGDQIVSHGSTLVFNELEIKNEKGVKFASPIGIRKMIGTYKVIGEMEIVVLPQIIGDVSIDGDLKIRDIALDMGGHNILVTGNVTQISKSKKCIVNINGGSLEVLGNYIMGPDYNYTDIYSILQMTNDSDYVYVGGDFITRSGNRDLEDRNWYLTAGVMEVKGDFNCESYFGSYLAMGNHKVILSGTDEQVIYYDGWLVFNELEITNKKGIRFDSLTPPISKMKGNYKIVGEMEIYVAPQIIGDVSIDGDLKIRDIALDMGGHNILVTGNVTQISKSKKCIVNINGGSLEVLGNYIMGPDYNYTDIYSILQMTNDSDYVYVGGDFITRSGNRDLEDRNWYLTAGVMEVKGDFNCESYFGSYLAMGNHKVILSGTDEQVIYYDGWLVFNELEITNTTGIRFDSLTPPINKMKGNYKIVGEMKLCVTPQIIGDVTIDGDLKIRSGTLNLNGFNLTITGNFNQSSEYETSIVDINGGNLKVLGDYSIISGTEYREEGIFAALKMINEEDYVYVGGDFSTKSNVHIEIENFYERVNKYLTAGTMEVKGDFYCKRDYGWYVASGSHKLILSGSDLQTLYNDSGWMVFNELEIKNEVGIRFDFPVAIRRIGAISVDTKIDGSLTIADQVLDLDGHSLTITGNLNQLSTYGASLIKINGGSLTVGGDYNVGYNIWEEQPELLSDSGSVLEMTNDSDYVYVGGNFTTYSVADHTGYLTAGTIEVKGDFTQGAAEGHPMNFAASGTHNTVLSGDTVQTVTFNDPETSSFNILKLTNPIDAGYIFNTTPVWKVLEE